MRTRSHSLKTLGLLFMLFLSLSAAARGQGPLRLPPLPDVEPGVRGQLPTRSPARTPSRIGVDLKQAVAAADLIVEASVQAVLPREVTLVRVNGRQVPQSSVGGAVFRITGYLDACTPSAEIFIADPAALEATPERFKVGDRYILFLNQYGSGGFSLPGREPIPRYSLTAFTRVPGIDSLDDRPLLIRVDGSRLHLIIGGRDPYWGKYEGADAGQFLAQIASFTKPPERCFERQAEAAAKKEREAQAKAEKEARKKTEEDRKAKEKEEKKRN